MKDDYIIKLVEEVFPIKIYHADYYLPNKLTMPEKMYLALLEKTNNDFVKSDLIMGDMISHTHLSNIKKKLSNLGLINLLKFNNAEDIKDFVSKNSRKGLICEWCGSESYILHKHHYPILRKDGGDKVVYICPNCHYTYHYILGGNIDNE